MVKRILGQIKNQIGGAGYKLLPTKKRMLYILSTKLKDIPMKFFLPPFVFSVVCFYPAATYGQIIEEIDMSVIEGAASLPVKPDSNQCVPPCRKGFFCNGGQCISKCNPPCPDGMDCWDDAECHSRITTIKKALNEINEVSKVFAKEELVQGVVIRTNIRNAQVRLLDTTFVCDGELFLNVPNGDYSVYVDAPKCFINEEDLEVRLGTIDTLEVTLRPFQMYGGIAIGISSMEEFNAFSGEVNLGIGLFALTYTGFTGTYIGTLSGKNTWLTNYKDVDIPDTAKEEWTELLGMGCSFGYLGIKPVARKIKFIPQVAFGYWEYDDQTYYRYKFQNGKSGYITDMENHEIEKYYFRPALDIRIGEKVFNFNCRISVYVGTGIPIATVAAGFQVAVPR